VTLFQAIYLAILSEFFTPGEIVNNDSLFIFSVFINLWTYAVAHLISSVSSWEFQFIQYFLLLNVETKR